VPVSPPPNDARVDVGIPAYRRATFLADAIESVLAQTEGRWALTIVDNGPGEPAIVEAVRPFLSDPRVSYRATGESLSLADNWTKTISQGHARYVALLPDDDRWHPTFLEARLAALDAHPDCAFAFGECVQTDEDGRSLGAAPVRFPPGVLSRERLAEELTRHNPIVPASIVVRRSAYAAVGARFDGSWHYCDWEMWARLAARFPAFYLAVQDNDFRRHESANSYVRAERPERLLAMIVHVEDLFERELPGLASSGLTRARNRSRILLRAAADVHSAGGWRASRSLHLGAVRAYPPVALSRTSLTLVARSLLGRRRARAFARALRPLRRDERSPTA
jgi:glycosyltransferase involved in cell wall biosynthesis